MTNARDIAQNPRKGKSKRSWTGPVASVYRIFSFILGSAGILIVPSVFQPITSHFLLVGIIGVYSLAKVLYPFRQYSRSATTYAVLGFDLLVCSFAIVSTGGLHSPYLLYALCPVLTAGLFMDVTITAGIAGLSLVVVTLSHLFNPFAPLPITTTELGYLWVYVAALCLTSALPYLVNVNVKRQWRYEETLRERQRLSHEIHDGAAQTASVLCWQVRLVRRRLAEMNIDFEEVAELEELAERAQHETRESLELLRNYVGDGRLVPHIKDYLENFKENTSIDVSLDAETEDIHLDAPVELEVLRICQEALTNVRKHANAHSVRVTLKQVDGHIRLGVADDGCGFDTLVSYRDGEHSKGHGLAVMQERAESIEARYQIVSNPGHGTEVQVDIPTKKQWSAWR